MTQPVTTSNVPPALKQGVKRPTPAKKTPAHKAATKVAARTNQAHKTR